MPVGIPNRGHQVEVVDLVSSDDDTSVGMDTPSDVDFPLNPPSDMEPAPMANHFPVNNFEERQAQIDDVLDHAAIGGQFVHIDGEYIFIPDEIPNEVANEPAPQPPPVPPTMACDEEAAPPVDHFERELDVTADECLARVLEIFPEISHEYVRNLFNDFDREGDYEVLPGWARRDNIIEQLVSNPTYPKEEKGKQALKRKRRDSIEEDPTKKWERVDRIPGPNYLKGSMQAMLKAEFPEIPHHYIKEVLSQHVHLFPAYIALAKAKDDTAASSRAYGRGRPSTKNLADATVIAMNCGSPDILEELEAARLRVQTTRSKRAAEKAKIEAEHANLEQAKANGSTAECSACFDDIPMNRQIYCEGSEAHFICYECALNYIKSEVGESRCRVLCCASDCGAGFSNSQLSLLSDEQLLEKLAQLQQEKDIRDAGLDNLEECPFCDYKAICPPIEEDFEFRCLNEECEKVSCRRCKSISHIPLSCEQHAKENKLNSRHKIEEAMTAALIRACNKCKKQFVKIEGCNKMTCPSCNNLQCYVCSTTITNYDHFDQTGRPGRAGKTTSGKCPLYDNVEERHKREVEEAEAAARAQVIEGHPDITAEDLEIKVSDAVKKSTAARSKRAGGHDGAMDFFPGMAHPPVFFNHLFEDGPPDHNPRIRPWEREHFGGQDAANMAAAQQRARDLALQRAQLVNQQRNLMAQRRQAAMRLQQHAQAAVGNVQNRYGPPGIVQGYIPVLGLHAPGAQQPHVPRPAPAQQMPQGQQFPGPQGLQGLVWPVQNDYGFNAQDFRDPFGDMNFHIDGAADDNHPQPQPAMQEPNNNQQAGLQIRRHDHPAPNPNQHAQPANNQYDPINPFQGFNDFQPGRRAHGPAAANNGNPGPPQQAFDQGIRQNRQNFQELEMLRQNHEVNVLQARERRQQEWARDEMQRLRGLMDGNP